MKATIELRDGTEVEVDTTLDEIMRLSAEPKTRAIVIHRAQAPASPPPEPLRFSRRID